MSIFGSDFTFNGTSLKSIDADYFLVAFDVETETTAHQRTINQSSITNDGYIKHYYGHMADTALTVDLTITRCSNEPITKADATALSNWLFATSEPKVMYVTPVTGESAMYENVDFIGSFTSMTYEEGHSAITFHFENISGYAFTKEQTNVIAAGTESVTIVNNGSKTGEVIYPVVTIEPATSGTITITMGGLTTFSVEGTAGVEFTIRDRSMYLSNGQFYSFENLNNFNWPYLLDGENVWTITGNAKITVKARYLVTTGY